MANVKITDLTAASTPLAGTELLEIVQSGVSVKAHFDDEIVVGVKTERLGRSSMTVKFGIFRDGQHLISGENIYVYAENGGSLPLPDDFKRRIEALEQP